MTTPAFLREEPRGLQREYCEVCDGTYTVAKGRCTGCIMREENRKQGVIYLIVGGPIAAFGAIGFLMFGISLMGIASVFTGVFGLGIFGRGMKAVLLGRSAE